MFKQKYADFSAWFAKVQFRYGTEKRRRLWLKLATLLKNGVPVTTAIDELRARRVRTNGVKCPQAIALANWLRLMQNGNQLSYAVNGWVTPEETMLIMSGERSGKLQESLQSVAVVISGIRKVQGTVFRGLAAPGFLLAATLVLLYIFAVKFIPIFTRHYKDHVWTGTAKAMIVMSDFVQNWFGLVLLIMIAVIGAFIYSLPRMDGKIRIVLDRYLPYSLYRVVQGSSWLIAISALINAGMSNEEALDQLSKPAQPWLKTRLNDCLRYMRTGLNMGDALRKSPYAFPDNEIIDDLGIYSRYSGFSESLNALGNEWIEESVKQIEMRMVIIKNVAIVIIALLVTFIAIGSLELQFPTGTASPFG